MSSVALAPHRDAPLRLTVRDGVLDCPRGGHIAATVCRGCRYLHGTMEDVDLTVLCGWLERRPAIVRPTIGEEPLIFNIDWPND